MCTRKCFICFKPSLMGYHPLCILENVKAELQGERYLQGNFTQLFTEGKSICSHCPFRKDKPVWIDEGRKQLNRLRLQYGLVQDCHKTINYKFNTSIIPTRRTCRGNIETIKGDSKLCFSPEEFKEIEPTKTQLEAMTNYFGEDSVEVQQYKT